MPGSSAKQKRTPASRPDDSRYASAISSTVRKRGYLLPRFLPRQVMSTPPALSITSGNSPVTGGSTASSTPNNLLTGGLITIAGGAAIIPSTIGNTAMYRRSDRAPDVNNRKDGPWKIIFGTDAVMFAIQVYWDASSVYRLLVDDQYVSLTPASPGVSGATRWLLVDFTSAGGAKPRKIVFETTTSIQGVDIPATATIWPIPAKGPTVVYFGDSYTGGSNGNDSSFTTWPAIVADYLGWENTYQNAVGSTGILATVSGYANNAAGQIAAFAAANVTPDIVISTWGHNDTDTTANRVAGLVSAFQTMRALWPNALMIYGGPFYAGGTAVMSSTYAAPEAALISAVAGLADLTIPQSSGAGRPFFTGTGKVGATTGSGNSDTYIYSDGVHPTQAGHNYLGFRMAQELAARLS